MLTTENFARTQWCPLARGLVTAEISNTAISATTPNRHPDHGAPLNACRCIASACMAWRWHDVAPADTRLWKEAITQLDENGHLPTDANGDPIFNPERNIRPFGVGPDWELVNDEEDGWGWLESMAEYETRVAGLRAGRRGYCGQFGEPRHG